MSFYFKCWIISLGAQVRSLYESMRDKDLKTVKREAETYETVLQQLYVYAEQLEINLIEYYHSFVEIEKLLLLKHEYLKSE